ncbi:MAG: TolC family protein [Pirellulaceae bacterium]
MTADSRSILALRRVNMRWAIVLLAALILSGCTRAKYREHADSQVASILNTKTSDPRWNLPRTDIQPDTRSRFFNYDDPDCPPLPLDDPSAELIMECPGGIRGAKLWRRLPESPFWENPDWSAYFVEPVDMDPSGEPQILDLSLAQAVELSLIHSREYQQQLENLYLAALALTFERYRFQVRPFGFVGDFDELNSGIFYQVQPDDESIFGIGPATLGFSRLLPSGAQLVAELVNDTIWLLSGPGGSTSASSLAFSLVQPLARGAGREIALEDLTQTERNVLYAVRDFARFRKQFFVSTITGGQFAGLQRFLRGFEFLAGSSSAPSVGFYPVLLQLQQLRNRQYIVRTLEYIIDDLIATGADALDIASLKSTLVDTRGDLYRDERVFYDRLDQYKVQLGFPPDMDITLSDKLLESFEFVDPTILELEDGLRALAQQVREQELPPAQIKSELSFLMDQARAAGELVANDFAQLDALLPEHLAKLTPDEQVELTSILEEESARLQAVRTDIEQLAQVVEDVNLNEVDVNDPQLQQAFNDHNRQILVLVRGLSVVQTIVRVELVPIRPIDTDIFEAVDLAIENRLDLMNRQAQVVDARRKLEIAADLLEADVNVAAEALVNTQPLGTGDNPFDFRAEDSRYSVGLQFDTPLDRRAERNVFRSSQIAFDQAKRSFVGSTDNIKLEVRQSVRTIEQLAKTIVERSRRVQYSARELDLAEKTTDASRRALSINNALRSLNRAQDELIEVWLDYETTRLNLYRDMGTMQIDERGFWFDEFYQELLNQGVEIE